MANITPLVSQLAETIAAGLMGDLKAGRLPKCGIEEVRAAIGARDHVQAMGSFQIKQLETLVLRKLIAKVG